MASAASWREVAIWLCLTAWSRSTKAVTASALTIARAAAVSPVSSGGGGPHGGD